jgi:uncharacterized protein
MPQRFIDGYEFAGAGGVESGSLPLSGLPRLQDLLRSNAGSVAYEIRGVRDRQGRLALQIGVSGILCLTCQRCLEALDYAFDAASTLALARSEDEAAEESMDPDAPERIVAGPEMPVRDLVEDELLLLVPIAPRHERCDGKPGEAPAAQERKMPFAGLRDMLGNGKAGGRGSR